MCRSQNVRRTSKSVDGSKTHSELIKIPAEHRTQGAGGALRRTRKSPYNKGGARVPSARYVGRALLPVLREYWYDESTRWRFVLVP